MAVLRRLNVIADQLIQNSDLRAFESAASNDFDALIEAFITGTTTGQVIRGFEISMSGAIGGAATGLQVIVDPGAVLHITASQSGTFYLVPTGTLPQILNGAINTQVFGAFAPNSTNYVGIDYDRYLDPSTDAVVYIWDPTSNTQTSTIAPRGNILQYNFQITTSTWASTTLPIAIVVTDAGNNVVSITDCRNLLFRLGTGGSSPNPFYVYPWDAQPEGRTENPPTSTSNSINPFEGGDKMLFDLKDWMNAIMTSLLEIKGTTYWYSQGTSGSLSSLREDLGNTFITGKGHIEHSATTPGLINWDQNIYIDVIGSQLSYEIAANPSSTDITLANGQAAYIILTRDVLIIPNLIFTNGSNIVTSVGSVAWTTLLQSGDFVKLASDTHAGYYQIQSINSLSQVTLTENFMEVSTGTTGAIAQYAFGSYSASSTPSTPRNIYITSIADVPVSQNTFWLWARADNGGSVAKVYIRFLGQELQQGETEEISDGTPQQLLQYVGSPIESASQPQYMSALYPGAVPLIQQLTMGAESTYTMTSEYFYLYTAANFRKYYVWFQLNGVGADPTPANTYAGIQVNLTTGMTNAQVSSATSAAIASVASAYFTTSVSTNIITITNKESGTTHEAENVNVDPPFSIAVTQSGTGTGNYFIQDGDNLTLAIKLLDQAIGNLYTETGGIIYDEPVDIVASGATPPTSLDGPISSGTLITLPNNSRAGDAAQAYVVGDGTLMVFLNGQYLRLGEDWLEVGSSQTSSTQIQILQGLVVGDSLQFRITSVGGGGQPGPQGVPGPQGPQGIEAIGSPINVSTKTSNYTVTTTDVVLLADCTSGPITFTLPSASAANGFIFFFKKRDSTSNALNVTCPGSALIDGNTTFQPPLTYQYMSITVVSDGTNFWVI